MGNVKLRAAVEAKWATESLKDSVTTTSDLVAIAIRLLVEDVGADAARQHIRDELGAYLANHKGDGPGAVEASKD